MDTKELDLLIQAIGLLLEKKDEEVTMAEARELLQEKGEVVRLAMANLDNFKK